jgi:hypothetical protein
MQRVELALYVVRQALGGADVLDVTQQMLDAHLLSLLGANLAANVRKGLAGWRAVLPFRQH